MDPLPSEPLIVFAGAARSFMPSIAKAKPEALMFSYHAIQNDKRVHAMIRDGFDWGPRMYLDSGAFTFLRRAGAMNQSREKSDPMASWPQFKAYAKKYVDYLEANKQCWEHIIELDVEELYGIPVADRLRAKLEEVVGRDKLMPVWHAQRGQEGWRAMIERYPYVAVSMSKASGGRNRRSQGMVRDMIREAHDRGVLVHMLGATTLDIFEIYDCDTLDSSSWSMGTRFGEIKVLRGKVTLPKHDSGVKRPLVHSHLAQLKDYLAQWGYTLEDARTNIQVSWEVGVRMLQLRQDEIRRRHNARLSAQAASEGS